MRSVEIAAMKDAAMKSSRPKMLFGWAKPLACSRWSNHLVQGDQGQARRPPSTRVSPLRCRARFREPPGGLDLSAHLCMSKGFVRALKIREPSLSVSVSNLSKRRDPVTDSARARLWVLF